MILDWVSHQLMDDNIASWIMFSLVSGSYSFANSLFFMDHCHLILWFGWAMQFVLHLWFFIYSVCISLCCMHYSFTLATPVSAWYDTDKGGDVGYGQNWVRWLYVAKRGRWKEVDEIWYLMRWYPDKWRWRDFLGKDKG